MQKLIIVCGLPASGKTTIAKALSKNLKITCIHKDTIKESLYEIMEMETLEDSKQVGLYSILLQFRLAEELLLYGLDLILEAPFYFEEDYKIFIKWQNKYNLKIYSVICQIPENERKKRFRNRSRHHGHHDTERVIKDDKRSKAYKKLPGKKIIIQTNEPVNKLTEELKSQLV